MLDIKCINLKFTDIFSHTLCCLYFISFVGQKLLKCLFEEKIWRKGEIEIFHLLVHFHLLVSAVAELISRQEPGTSSGPSCECRGPSARAIFCHFFHHNHRVGLEGKQVGHKPVHKWDGGAADRGYWLPMLLC